jgi:exopolysaccharide biosynthesis polyprenyl glycosylphosphotransferase
VFAVKEYNFSRGYIAVYFLVAALILSLSRLVYNRLKIGLMDNGWGVKNALIVGNNEAIRDIVDHLSNHRAFGYRIVGILTDDKRGMNCLYRDIRIIGSVADCVKLISEKQIGQVFIPDLEAGPADYDALLTLCNLNNVEVRLVSHKVDLLARVAGINDMPGFSLTEPSCRGLSVAYSVIKRLLDLLVSAIGLVLLFPLLFLIAIVIKLDSPGSVLFRQRRIKRGGKCFWMYKFRTMREGSEIIREDRTEINVKPGGSIFKTRQDPRITRAGRWLRRLSLDELPQLINVLKGEMSLVGPRPPLPSEVEHYQEWHKYRLNGPQGMTGLWQVSGRSELSFEEMVLLDIYYLEHWSPLMDLEIMVKTIPAVITAKGAY